MKNANKHHDVILDYIKANPGSTIDGIKEGNPKLSDIIIRGALKHFQTENLVTAGDAGEYTLVSKKNAAAESKAGGKDDKKAEKKDAPKKSEEEDMGPATKTSRDNRKFDFLEHKALSKGKLALAIIRQYVSDFPKTNLATLQEVFESEKIQKRYGCVEEIGKARKHTVNNRERYFFSEKDLIKLGNQRVVVTNQWGLSTILPLITIAQKKMKYKVTVSK